MLNSPLGILYFSHSFRIDRYMKNSCCFGFASNLQAYVFITYIESLLNQIQILIFKFPTEKRGKYYI